MKAVFLYVSVLVILLCLFSCVSSKKMIFLQDEKADVIVPSTKQDKKFTLQEKEYQLKPDDQISIRIFSLTQEKYNFFGSPEFEVKIDRQGRIELPVVGHVPVIGLTLSETEEKLKTLTVDYLKSPTISVKLTNFNYTVLGEVGTQGTFTIPEPKINVLEAIGRAGGLTDFADRSNIRIIRHENGIASIYRVNVLEDNILASETYFLKPGDVVMIDPLRAKNIRQYQIGTLSLVLSLMTGVGIFLFQIFN